MGVSGHDPVCAGLLKKKYADFEWPFRSHTNPVRGSSDTPTIVRASDKLIQREKATGSVLGSNAIGVGKYFNGTDLGEHYGIPVERAVTNSLSSADDIDPGGANWAANNLTCGAKSITNPYGEANTAQRLTPTGAQAADYQVLGINPNNKTFTMGVWAKAETAHNATIVIMDTGQSDISMQTIAVTTEWEYFTHEHTFGTPGGLTIFTLMPDQSDTLTCDFYLPQLQDDTSRLVTPCVTTSAADQITLPFPDELPSNNWVSTEGGIFFEVFPLHKGDDGILHSYLEIDGLNFGFADNMYGLKVEKTAADELNFSFNAGGWQDCKAAVDNTSLPRGQWSRIAVTYKGVGVGATLYLNGAQHATRGVFTPGVAPTATSKIYLGSDSSGANQADAVIRNLRIWGSQVEGAHLLALTN